LSLFIHLIVICFQVKKAAPKDAGSDEGSEEESESEAGDSEDEDYGKSKKAKKATPSPSASASKRGRGRPGRGRGAGETRKPVAAKNADEDDDEKGSDDEFKVFILFHDWIITFSPFKSPQLFCHDINLISYIDIYNNVQEF
jgi:hypothetical protein